MPQFEKKSYRKRKGKEAVVKQKVAEEAVAAAEIRLKDRATDTHLLLLPKSENPKLCMHLLLLLLLDI